MAASAPPRRRVHRLGRFVDDRLGVAGFARSALNKVFPDHWSFMLGEVALYAFVVLVATGLFLTFFYEPSRAETVYQGVYEPLRGVSMSEAYASVVELSWDVRFGLVMRQAHHWAALVFVGAILAHAARIFFTGAYRRPREINWLIGVTLLLLSMFNGFLGYSLVDDMLSGLGLRIGSAILLSLPVVGAWALFLLAGGEFPSEEMIPRMYVVHVLVLPAIIAALIGIHLAVVSRQKHTQFPGRGRTERNVVGSRLWPAYAAKSIGLLAIVAGVLVVMGGLFQINPVWYYGPFEPGRVTTAAQPDYYVGWLEGALRLAPPARLTVGGYAIPEVFWPGVVLPMALFGLLYAWPFLERAVTGERGWHQLLDRPRDHPVRTAIGTAYLTVFSVLLLAGGQDIFAAFLGVSVVPVTRTLRALLLALPVVTGLVAWFWCRQLAAARPLELTATAGEPPVAPPSPAAPVGRPGGRRLPVAGRLAAAGGIVGMAAAFLAGWRRGRRRRR